MFPFGPRTGQAKSFQSGADAGGGRGTWPLNGTSQRSTIAAISPFHNGDLISVPYLCKYKGNPVNTFKILKNRGFSRCAALFLAESQKRARPKAGWGRPGPGTQKFSKNHEKTCWSMSMVPDRSVPGPVKNHPGHLVGRFRTRRTWPNQLDFPTKSLENTFPDFCSWIQVQILHF